MTSPTQSLVETPSRAYYREAMDVLTPAGVSQANELDYTVHNPVSIRGVFIP